MRSFGPKANQAPPAREPFEFVFMRDDVPERHQFTARAVTDVAALAMTLTATERQPQKAMAGMLAMISKMLDNKDGTPAQWEPTPLPARTDARGSANPPSLEEMADAVADGADPKAWMAERMAPRLANTPEWPSDAGVLDDGVTKFRGPDGALYPMEDAAKFLEFSAGSSRRRWLHLMNDEADLVVDAVALQGLFEWLVGLAAGGRPTPPSH